MTDDTEARALINGIKHYAQSPSGIVAVLSENIGGLVLVAKWVPADKIGPPIQFEGGVHGPERPPQ